MRMTPASLSGLALSFLLLCVGGCTTTDEVIASWRGQPIEAVVDQWGPPGWYETVSHSGYIGAYDHRYQDRSHVQPIREGANTYTWSYTSHTFYPERCEVIEYKDKDGCKTYTTTRTIPAHWVTSSDDFYLTTDDAGRVESGGSSYEGKLWPLCLMLEKRSGWGSLRKGWDPDQPERFAAE